MAWSGIERSAISWWQTKRPLNWDLRMHLDNATVNCFNEAERDLAKAVGAFLGADNQ